jgi:hypothetical protein
MNIKYERKMLNSQLKTAVLVNCEFCIMHFEFVHDATIIFRPSD